MAEHVLCRNGMKASVASNGERTLVFVKHGASIRFWADKSEVERCLNGTPVELLAHGGSCRVEIIGEQGWIHFKTDNGNSHSCSFPKQVLIEALADA